MPPYHGYGFLRRRPWICDKLITVTGYLVGCSFVLLVSSSVSCRLGYDNGADAAPEVVRTFCQQLGSDWGYNYCRDFDDDEPFEFGWDRRVAEAGALVQSDTLAFSEPAAFLARVPVAEGDNPCVRGFSESKGTGNDDFMQLNFQMRMGSSDSQTPFAGAFMTLRATDENGAQRCSFTIYGDGTAGGVLQSSGSSLDHPFTVRFPLEYEWTKVVLNVDYRD